MRKRTIMTAVGSCELPARETIVNLLKRQSDDASMRDAIPLICTRVCCRWHATRSIFRERSLEKIERCRTSESFACHAPAATDNHGYFTNTEYFRISLIPLIISNDRHSRRSSTTASTQRRTERWSSDADRLPSSRVVSRAFLRMAPRIERSVAHTTRKGVTSFSLNRSVWTKRSDWTSLVD